MNYNEQIKLIADQILGWLTPYGRPDPAKCPFVYTKTWFNSMNLHSPTFMAIGLYKASTTTGEIKYKEAADRLIAFYLACLRNPQKEHDHYSKMWMKYMEEHDEEFGEAQKKWCLHILTWPFIHGMALAGYRYFKEYNSEEVAFDSKASAAYEWLLEYKWNVGSYFQNGYGNPELGIIDCANSDDNCHMGRGLIGYYKVSGREDVLEDAIGLAKYYTTECVPGTYKGCWSSKLGTWVIGPTVIDNIEHFTGKQSCEISWGYTSVGAIEFLMELWEVLEDEELKCEIASKCVSSAKWAFDSCQFDDGAVGMSKKDDKWLGMTAAAIMSFMRVRDAGVLSVEEQAEYQQKAELAREWLVAHVDSECIKEGGYYKVTGHSELFPPDNGAWMFGLTLECLSMLDNL